MPREPLEVLVVHKMPDGTFAAGDALQKLRIVQDGFKSAAEAEKFLRILSGSGCHQATQAGAMIDNPNQVGTRSLRLPRGHQQFADNPITARADADCTEDECAFIRASIPSRQ